jgi:acetyl-CoA C-acetyltransferase/acetyl-CoA acyltransferase
MGMRSILSDLSDRVFVAGFEMQNTLKPVYGADVLAGAAYYKKERKRGEAHFFPALFSKRAKAYYERFGYEQTRKAMAAWYAQMIENARKNPKAQEFENATKDLIACGMSPPDPVRFLPDLNHYDCSKVSDGAAGLVMFSQEGERLCKIRQEGCVEIVGIGEAVSNIAHDPEDETELLTTKLAVEKAFKMAGIQKEDLAVLEIHDCFSITAILALEAIGFAPVGKGPDFILEGNTHIHGKIPTNLSGGLCGFGHPTGATGIRQMVDLLAQLTHRAKNQAQLKSPYGMMISMGGNDKTVTCIIVKRVD